ncbi:MAG: hypothetical protein GY771_10035 [bacterium]|nr:hypothetical protein [bacterium]
MEHLDERTLSKHLDGELGETRCIIVEGHLKECARCRREYEQLAALSEYLELLPVSEPGPYFTSRVKRAAAEEQRERLRSRFLVPIATAASLISLVIGGYLGQSVYTAWTEDAPDYENGSADYFDVSPIQDYPEGSFGDAYIDLISEEVNDEG